MSKLINLLIALIILIFIGGILYILAIMSFQGTFDKKYTREELTQNFINHKQSFSDVVNYFKNNIPPKIEYSVAFWQKGKNNVSLHLYPHVIGPQNNTIGASDVAIDSEELDDALKTLGWSRTTLTTLTDKLKKTNCNHIRNIDHIIELSPYQTGWGSFTYRVWDKPIVDSLISNYGSPLGTDSFSIKVVLNYSSAL